MRSDEYGYSLFITQNLQVLPKIAPGAGIQSCRRFVEQQHSGMMQQSLRQLDATLHPSRKRSYLFLCAIGEPHSRQDLLDPPPQCAAPQSVQVPLMPEIFVRCQLQVNALSLEYNPDLSPQTRRILRRIESHHDRVAGRRNHQGRKYSEESRFPASIWPEETKQFGRADVE